MPLCNLETRFSGLGRRGVWIIFFFPLHLGGSRPRFFNGGGCKHFLAFSRRRVGRALLADR